MEALGAASSVLQVVQIGFQLTKTLYTFASDVKDAEKDVKAIAQDVRLTTIVLKQTYDQIKADSKLYTESAMKDFDQVLSGCKDAFQEVKDGLTKLQGSKDGTVKTSVSFTGKLKWGFNQKKKLDILRANLEKLKSTLLVMLNVFVLGRMLDSKAACHDTEKVEVEKLQIESLIRAKDSAAQKYEELVVSFSAWQARLNNELPPAKRGAKEALGKDGHIISGRFGLCITAVERLSDSINIAANYWLNKRLFQYYTMEGSMADMKRDFDELTSCAKQRGIFWTPDSPSSSTSRAFNQPIADYVSQQQQWISSTSAEDLGTCDSPTLMDAVFSEPSSPTEEPQSCMGYMHMCAPKTRDPSPSAESIPWTSTGLGIQYATLGGHPTSLMTSAFPPSVSQYIPSTETKYGTSSPPIIHAPQPFRRPTYANIAPNPAGVTSKKRSRDEDESTDAASGCASKAPRKPASSISSADLSEDDRFLVQLKEEEKLSWEDIATRFQINKGKHFQVVALQMRYKRLREKVRIWEEQDLQALQLAHEYREKYKWEIISAKMLDFGIKERWAPWHCASKWPELEAAAAATAVAGATPAPIQYNPSAPNSDFTFIPPADPMADSFSGVAEWIHPADKQEVVEELPLSTSAAGTSLNIAKTHRSQNTQSPLPLQQYRRLRAGSEFHGSESHGELQTGAAAQEAEKEIRGEEKPRDENEPPKEQVILENTELEKQSDENMWQFSFLDVSIVNPSDDTNPGMDSLSCKFKLTLPDSGMGSIGAEGDTQSGIDAVPILNDFDLTTLDEMVSEDYRMTRQQSVMKTIDVKPVLSESSAWLAEEDSIFLVVDDLLKRWTAVCA